MSRSRITCNWVIFDVHPLPLNLSSVIGPFVAVNYCLNIYRREAVHDFLLIYIENWERCTIQERTGGARLPHRLSRRSIFPPSTVLFRPTMSRANFTLIKSVTCDCRAEGLRTRRVGCGKNHGCINQPRSTNSLGTFVRRSDCKIVEKQREENLMR